MKKKFLAFLLILFPIFSLGIVKAETIKIVSDTAYAPFEFKDSDQTYKGIDVDIINKVAEIKGESNCPYCAIGHEANKHKIWKLSEMDADHVAAWSKGGTTDINNCQMLCKSHNRSKGNK